MRAFHGPARCAPSSSCAGPPPHGRSCSRPIATSCAAAPALAPARHWPDRPHVRGGLDVAGGGTWLGLNDDGVVAAVLNRRGTLGPEPGKRSRGELVLEALDHAEATRAADALRALDPAA